MIIGVGAEVFEIFWGGYDTVEEQSPVRERAENEEAKEGGAEEQRTFRDATQTIFDTRGHTLATYQSWAVH